MTLLAQGSSRKKFSVVQPQTHGMERLNLEYRKGGERSVPLMPQRSIPFLPFMSALFRSMGFIGQDEHTYAGLKTWIKRFVSFGMERSPLTLRCKTKCLQKLEFVKAERIYYLQAEATNTRWSNRSHILTHTKQ